jgi:hypothetical protein
MPPQVQAAFRWCEFYWNAQAYNPSGEETWKTMEPPKMQGPEKAAWNAAVRVICQYLNGEMTYEAPPPVMGERGDEEGDAGKPEKVTNGPLQ